MSDLATALKSAIRDASMSRYEIAHASGVSQSVITRFVNNKRDITLTTASKIAAVLNLGLAPLRTSNKKR